MITPLKFGVNPPEPPLEEGQSSPGSNRANEDRSPAAIEERMKRHISLVNVGSKKYFESVQYSNTLIELQLVNSFIRGIPGELALCPRIEKVDLSHNFIQSFGDVLYSMKSLRELNLSHNCLLSIRSEDTYKLFALEKLCLSNNSILYLTSDLSRLSLLQELHIDGNCLKAIPCSLSKLIGLKILRIDWPLYLQPPSSMDISKSAHSRISDATESSHNHLSLEKLFSSLQEMMECRSTDCCISDFIDRFSRAPSRLQEATPGLLRTALISGHQAIFNQLFDDLKYSCLPHSQEENRGRHLEQLLGGEVVEYLIFALKNGYHSIASHLINTEYSRHPDRHHGGDCPLHVAVECCALDCVADLLKVGHAPDCSDDCGNTPLHKLFLLVNQGCVSQPILARMKDQIRQIQEDHSSSFEGSFDYWGLAFLHFDIFQSNTSMVGKDKYFFDFRLEMLSMFLSHSADPNRYNKLGLCPWHYMLLKTDMVMFAAIHTHERRFDKIDWNVPFFFGHIPTLHIASQLDYWYCVVDLIVGKKKITTLGVDMTLRPAGEYIRKKSGKIPFKQFYKVFKRELQNHFKGLTCEKIVLKNLMKKSFEKIAVNRDVQFSSTLKPSLRKTGKLRLSFQKIPSFHADSIGRFKDMASERETAKLNKPQDISADDKHPNRDVAVEWNINQKSEIHAIEQARNPPLNNDMAHPNTDHRSLLADNHTGWLKLTIPHMLTLSRTAPKTGLVSIPTTLRNSFKKSELKLNLRDAPVQSDDTDEYTNVGPFTNRAVSSYRFNRSPGLTSMKLSSQNVALNQRIVAIVCKKYFKELVSFKLAVKNLTTTESDQQHVPSTYILYTISSHLGKISCLLARLGSIMKRDVYSYLLACMADKLSTYGLDSRRLSQDELNHYQSVKQKTASLRVNFEVCRYIETISAAVAVFKAGQTSDRFGGKASGLTSGMASPLIKLPKTLPTASLLTTSAVFQEANVHPQLTMRPIAERVKATACQRKSPTQQVLKNIREKFLSNLRREGDPHLQ